jgi:hypothetical protein
MEWTNKEMHTTPRREHYLLTEEGGERAQSQSRELELGWEGGERWEEP